MAIQWFPGHMHRARKQIAEAMPQVDLIIEVLDARLPFSSSNPIIPELRVGKPVFKVLNKADLADPDRTQTWLDYFNEQDDIQAMALTGLERKQVKSITQLCHKMLPQRREQKQSIRTMIMGIPNVGKSTLINTLAGKVVAKAGNQPALTRHPQQIKIQDGIVLSDTPGILWPKIDNVASGYRLAASGAVRDTALEYLDVAIYAGNLLVEDYETLICDRYKLKELPENGEMLIDAIGRKRGCLRSGGIVDMHKAAEIFIHELRSGKIGKITYETPETMEKELTEVAEIAAAKEAAQAEKLAQKNKGKRKQDDSDKK